MPNLFFSLAGSPRRGRRILLGLAFASLLSVASALAVETVQVRINADEQLELIAADGKILAQLPAPTLSRTVIVGGQSVQVTYGRDAENLLAAVVVPDPAKPGDFRLGINGKVIDGDSKSVVSLYFSGDRASATLDPGSAGVVKVDEQPVKSPLALRALNAPAQPAALTEGSLPTAPPSPARSPIVHRGPGSAGIADITPTGFTGRTGSSYGSLAPGQKSPMAYSVREDANAILVKAPGMPTLIGGTGKAKLQALQKSSGDGAVSPVDRLVAYSMIGSQPPKLEQNAAAENPNVKTVPSDQFYKDPKEKKLLVKGSDAAENLNLRYSARWAEPITPPAPATAPEIAPDQIKLVNVKGNVVVNINGDTKPATEGMVIPSGASVVTGPKASAAFFLGGVNSARLMPNSDGQAFQTLSGGKRDTVVDLKRGCVFAKVGQKAGEIQDFRVKTATGVAAAKGTDFAVNTGDGSGLQLFVVGGTVEMRDAQGNLLAIVQPTGEGGVGMASNPPLSNSEMTAILNRILEQASQFNVNTNNLAQRLANGSPLSADEQNYLNATSQVFYSVLGRRSDLTNPDETPLPVSSGVTPTTTGDSGTTTSDGGLLDALADVLGSGPVGGVGGIGGIGGGGGGGGFSGGNNDSANAQIAAQQAQINQLIQELQDALNARPTTPF